MIYTVNNRERQDPIDADYSGPAWKNIPAARLDHFMGDRPLHFPDTRLKLAWDAEALYVMFRVQDRFVRATRMTYQQDVYKDSCVEFFFKPNNDGSENYFNLETNCCGTALFAFQTGPRQGEVRIPAREVSAVTLAHSLEGPIPSELPEPVTWTIEYRLPFALLQKYCDVEAPAPGVVWKGNFYKIADDSSHPHYLTWAPVHRPRPDFHQPGHFGTLVFEQAKMAG